jgi:hypothetical protein
LNIEHRTLNVERRMWKALQASPSASVFAFGFSLRLRLRPDRSHCLYYKW